MALKADRVGCDDASRRRAWVEMVLAMVSGLIGQLAVYVVDRFGLPTLKLRPGCVLHCRDTALVTEAVGGDDVG